MFTVQSMLTGYPHAATPFSICYPITPTLYYAPHNPTYAPTAIPQKGSCIMPLLPAQYPIMPHMSLKCRTPFSQKSPWSSCHHTTFSLPVPSVVPGAVLCPGLLSMSRLTNMLLPFQIVWAGFPPARMLSYLILKEYFTLECSESLLKWDE